MTGVFSGAEWTLLIHYSRIIDFEHGIAPSNRVRSKYPGTLDARMSDFRAAPINYHCSLRRSDDAEIRETVQDELYRDRGQQQAHEAG